jgi:hypothetical protein
MLRRFEVRSSLLLGCAAALVACNAISGVDDFVFATGGGGQVGGQGGGGGQAASSVASTTATGAGGATSSVSTGPAPMCSGTIRSCDVFTTEGPCDDADCDWNKSTKVCSGTPRPCSDLTSDGQGKCESVGCVWTP